MTATATNPLTTDPDPRQVARVPLSRLCRVELRKSWDTRAGLWLLIGIGGITAAVVVIFLLVADARDTTLDNFLGATTLPQNILLPVLGVLLVTSEWSQRTGLVTFTLEPNRPRIAVAKVVATLVLAFAAVLLALAVSALATALAAVFFDAGGIWNLSGGDFGDIVVAQLIAVLQGVAFGMLIMNSAAAIVALFALPLAWTSLVNLVTALHDLRDWLDLQTTNIALFEHTMDAEAWAKLGVSVAVWVLLPLVLGTIRLLRREVKSA